MTAIKYYFEDFIVGETVEFGSYTVTKEEIIEFASEFDPQPFHLDEEAAKQSILGGLCTSGWHTMAIFMRLVCDGYALESASLGAPGVKEARWKRPLYAGDTVRLKRTCRDRRVSKSRPEMGICDFYFEMLNQDDRVITTIEMPAMFSLRAHADAPAAGD